MRDASASACVDDTTDAQRLDRLRAAAGLLVTASNAVLKGYVSVDVGRNATIVIDNPVLTDAFLTIPDEYYFKPSEFR